MEYGKITFINNTAHLCPRCNGIARTREILTEGYQTDRDDILTSVDIEEVRRIRVRFDIKERIRIREQQKELTKCSQEFTKNFIQDLPISGSGLHGWHGGAGGAAALYYTLRLLQVWVRKITRQSILGSVCPTK